MEKDKGLCGQIAAMRFVANVFSSIFGLKWKTKISSKRWKTRSTQFSFPTIYLKTCHSASMSSGTCWVFREKRIKSWHIGSRGVEGSLDQHTDILICLKQMQKVLQGQQDSGGQIPTHQILSALTVLYNRISLGGIVSSDYLDPDCMLFQVKNN